MPNVPTSETSRETHGPALFVCGSRLTASCYAQPAPARRPAGRRWWPWRAVGGGPRALVGERASKERGGETAAGYYLRGVMDRCGGKGEVQVSVAGESVQAAGLRKARGLFECLFGV